MSRRALIAVENLSVPADRRVWMEAQALRDSGWMVTVICPRGIGRDLEPHTVLDGIEIRRFPLAPASGSALSYVREFGQATVRIGYLGTRLGLQRPFDVVQVCNPPDLLLPALRLLGARGTRFVFDHHDLVPELFETRFGGRGSRYRAALALERLTFALADVSIATNDSYRRVATGRGRMRPDDTFVVRNAPKLEVFTRGMPNPALRHGREHLLAYVGVMGPQDDVEAAIEALASLKRRRSDWRAVFAGEGSSLPHLRELVHARGLDEDVDFLGWCDDRTIVELLSTASVALAPEMSSPLNDVSTMIKVAEYMAMELPVVAFDLPETRFTAGEAAVYAATGDTETFAAHLDALLEDEERRLAMGRFGRARVERELSWPTQVTQLLAAYERAIAR
jgi:glycosyltransferase involved in cell wall biosynthesis